MCSATLTIIWFSTLSLFLLRLVEPTTPCPFLPAPSSLRRHHFFLHRSRSCSRQQPGTQAISGNGGGGARGFFPVMRLATGGGAGGGGRRREVRSGSRLSVPAPPPPQPPRATPLGHALKTTTTRTRKPQNKAPRSTTPRGGRTVRFDRCVRMVLVPARRDLDAAIVHGVWWGADDVAEFRMAAAKHFFQQHGGRVARSSWTGGGGGATPSEDERDKPEDATKRPISVPAM